MIIELVFDNRVDPLQVIRTRVSRRKNKILFHLHKLPFRDSDSSQVTTDRRSDHDRRNH